MWFIVQLHAYVISTVQISTKCEFTEAWLSSVCV